MPIVLHGMAMPAEMSGCIVRRGGTLHVFYDEAADGLDRDLIILHEVSHPICGQPIPQVADDALTTGIIRHLPPETVRAVLHQGLGRGAYASDKEREVELQARLILLAAQGLRTGVPLENPEAMSRYRRLQDYYRGRKGRR